MKTTISVAEISQQTPSKRLPGNGRFLNPLPLHNILSYMTAKERKPQA